MSLAICYLVSPQGLLAIYFYAYYWSLVGESNETALDYLKVVQGGFDFVCLHM